MLKSGLGTIATYSALPAIIFVGCLDNTDEGYDPCEMPLSATRTSVGLTGGTFVTVGLSGTPPFSIMTSPDSSVASTTLLDSSLSPATLVVSVPITATIGDHTNVVVGDGCMHTVVIAIVVTTGNASISYSDDIQPIWDVNCQSRGCHPGGGAPFSLDRFVSWSNLYFAGVTNTNCGAAYRVVGGLNGGPGNPDSSLLYLLVTGKTSCQRMPLSTDAADTLSKADQDKIKAWILDGAQNN